MASGDGGAGTIRSRQKAAVQQMINGNEWPYNALVAEPTWKVLIMDKYAQDIISPLLPVRELRDLGVTLHMLLKSERDDLPDVPAVYFVAPDDENVKIICKDLSSQKYKHFFFNFITPISRDRLEIIAESAIVDIVNPAEALVSKIMDQFLSFISLEDDLFVLKRYTINSPMSYYAINDPSTSEDQMKQMIESVAHGLFSVCATLGVVPIIRAQKNNAAEQIAMVLDQKLRDNLRDTRNNLFALDGIRSNQMGTTRPVIVLADRSADLATMLHHTWTYQALIHDVIGMDQNRITMNEKGKNIEYDLNSSKDSLWSSHKGSAFPLVAEAIQESLDAYRSSKDEIEKLKHAMGVDGDIDPSSASLITDATSKLGSTVTSLPQLLEQKRLIDLHTNVASSLLEVIKSRKLDGLFELEQKILQKAGHDSSLKIDLPDCSNAEDVLRVLLIYYLSTDHPNKVELEKLRQKLVDLGAEHTALRFVEKLRSISNLGRGVTAEDHSGAGTKTVSMFGKLLDTSSKFVMEGVKNLVPKKHNLPLTKLVDSVCIPASSSMVGMSQSAHEADSLRYFDPKVSAGGFGAPHSLRPSNAPSDVILFVVGGGSYVEYQNLIEWGHEKNIARVTYGCTELVSPTQFLQQLSALGAHHQ